MSLLPMWPLWLGLFVLLVAFVGLCAVIVGSHYDKEEDD
jgi:hypothetical protein